MTAVLATAVTALFVLTLLLGRHDTTIREKPPVPPHQVTIPPGKCIPTTDLCAPKKS
ncbi:MAG TPA: hypothetical protein VK277_13710 [Acidimicrobiales bacterium]|nr:hypothetical protein [Acidimicrobiales bacterium]